MATKKQAATQKAKEQADDALNKLSYVLKATNEFLQLKKKYNELKEDYLELSTTVTGASINSARILRRHHIERSLTIDQGIHKEGSTND
jgi:hypothetical protein